jgi:hypothetical protein
MKMIRLTRASGGANIFVKISSIKELYASVMATELYLGDNHWE